MFTTSFAAFGDEPESRSPVLESLQSKWVDLHAKRADFLQVIDQAETNQAEGGQYRGVWMWLPALHQQIEQLTTELLRLRAQPRDETQSRSETAELESWVNEIGDEAEKLVEEIFNVTANPINAVLGDAFLYRQKLHSDRMYLAKQIKKARRAIAQYRLEMRNDSAKTPAIQELMTDFNFALLKSINFNTRVEVQQVLSLEEAFDLTFYEFDMNVKTELRGTSLLKRLEDIVSGRYEDRRMAKAWRIRLRSIAPQITNDHKEKVIVAAIIANADISHFGGLLSFVDSAAKASQVVDYFRSQVRAGEVSWRDVNNAVTAMANVWQKNCETLVQD